MRGDIKGMSMDLPSSVILDLELLRGDIGGISYCFSFGYEFCCSSGAGRCG